MSSNSCIQPNSYFDLQVNGYLGVDFNADELVAADVARVCEKLQEDGVGGILATVITDDADRMSRRLENICRVREFAPIIESTICGIHIEGPFINSAAGYVGAHPKGFVRPADRDVMSRLLDSAGGLTRVVTLAPECDEGGKLTQILADQKIIVSAGHCDSDLETLRASVDAGLSMFTHLGNGCPLRLPRHDNIIQRVLSMSEHLAIGFIADGIHIPYAALSNYLQVAGFEKSFVVTDAISAAGHGPGKFSLGSQTVVVDEDLATWSEDHQHLVGSALTMPSVADNLRRELSLSELQIAQLTKINPRNALGV